MTNSILKNSKFFLNLSENLQNKNKKLKNNNFYENFLLKFYASNSNKYDNLSENHITKNSEFLFNYFNDKYFRLINKDNNNFVSVQNKNYSKNIKNNTQISNRELNKFNDIFFNRIDVKFNNFLKENDINDIDSFYDTIFIFGNSNLEPLKTLLESMLLKFKNLKNKYNNNNSLKYLKKIFENFSINIIVIDNEKDFVNSLIKFDYNYINILLNDFKKEFKLKIELYFTIINNFSDTSLSTLFNNQIFLNLFNPLYLRNIYFLHTPDKLKNDYEFIIHIKKFINEKISQITFNFKTSGLSGKMWYRNLILNLKFLSKIKQNNYQPLNILKANFDNFKNTKNKQAILIGASPILEKQIVKIKEITKKNNNYFIFAMDNSLSLLNKYKIIPNFIIILDSRAFVKLFIPDSYYNIPLLCPLNINFKIFQKFNKVYYFNTDFYLNKYSKIFCKTPNITYPLTNIGSFSLILVYYLGFKDIISFGIDYSFLDRKYYHKEAYFYKYYLMYGNYLDNILTNSIKKTITQSEKKLFIKYKSEFEALLNLLRKTFSNNENKYADKTYLNQDKNIFFNNNFFKEKKQKDNSSDLENMENYFPLLSYYYLKTNSIKKTTKKVEVFINRFL